MRGPQTVHSPKQGFLSLPGARLAQHNRHDDLVEQPGHLKGQTLIRPQTTRVGKV
jgi:hypothetical protein